MKIAVFTDVYPDMVGYLYKISPEFDTLELEKKKLLIDNYVSFWGSAWEKALAARGYEVLHFPLNVPAYVKELADHYSVKAEDNISRAIEILKKFGPELMYFDCFDDKVLDRIKSSVPTIKKVFLWSGSPLVGARVFGKVDFTLSCAPEMVEYIKAHGHKAYHLHHAFNHYVNDEWPDAQESDVIFIGQIFRSIGYHIQRNEILTKLASQVDLAIYSAAAKLGAADLGFHLLKKLRWMALKPGYAMLSALSDKYQPKYQKARSYPYTPYSLSLRKSLRMPVFGISMYSTIKQAKVVLNTHADSSPKFASNMRLFETTGVGSCLLTDWKANMNELFIEDSEVVCYKSVDECVEKVKWLLNNPTQRKAIAEAGKKRTHTAHLIDHRVPQLLEYVHKELNR